MKIVFDPTHDAECLKHNDDSMCFVITRRGITLGKKWVAARTNKRMEFGSMYVFNFFEARPLETFEIAIGMDFDSDLIKLIKERGI